MALRATGRFAALLAGGSIVLGMLLSVPSAYAAEGPNNPECLFLPGRNFWHFQNETRSGKTVILDGYSGPQTTGKPVVTCKFRILKAPIFGSKGGEAYLDPKVKTVKVTTMSDGGGAPTVATYPNSANTCFRIVYSGKDSWELDQQFDPCHPPT